MARLSSLPHAATAIALLALAACAQKAPPGAPPPPVPYAEAILYDNTGLPMGKVTLLPQGEALAGSITVRGGLTPGNHGMHIHTIGECKLPDFTSAGPHLNPTSAQHGTQNPAGPHQGDLPMLTADARGEASLKFTAHTSLTALFDLDGASFVVHADPDDMKTDPTGNSGARVLCGVLYRKQGAGS
ncbi:superoxide dismutase [Cu-Zn] [Sphingobium sp. SYK-6]|uniref:superoxide dismutase family protein n=1 Tax=Sphingobium sp. (strain NBRC 103272 / SYK-6) TaxID=627192 RepID=UPI000227776E|nr:superoxide dismutase family protein [Sphingobium sp. SYK-6]BAK66233.1 superoxide dismutase [Cu-Zn] [Sphingobium sp. SYK-6]